MTPPVEWEARPGQAVPVPADVRRKLAWRFAALTPTGVISGWCRRRRFRLAGPALVDVLVDTSDRSAVRRTFHSVLLFSWSTPYFMFPLSEKEAQLVSTPGRSNGG